MVAATSISENATDVKRFNIERFMGVIPFWADGSRTAAGSTGGSLFKGSHFSFTGLVNVSEPKRCSFAAACISPLSGCQCSQLASKALVNINFLRGLVGVGAKGLVLRACPELES